MSTCITYAQRHELTSPQVRQAAVLLYNHIPKCGGLSLTHMLRQCYPEACDVHQNIFDARATPLTKQFYHGHGVSGIEHYLPAQKPYFYITILRHPWALAQSLVRFFSWLTPLSPLYQQKPEDLLLLQQPNILTHYLGNGHEELAHENLFHNYVFFGLQEYFPASLELLQQSIPELATAQSIAKNVSTKEAWHISPEIKERFYELNAADMALYDKAKEEFLRRAQNHTQKSNKTLTATAHLPSSNTQGDNFITVNSLKESIALQEDLPAMDMASARFENWLHIALHSMITAAEHRNFYQWLMARVAKRTSCLYFAFACAKQSEDAHLQAQLPMLIPALFTVCMQRDARNVCRILVQCRLETLHTWIACSQKQENISLPAAEQKRFLCTAYAWLCDLEQLPPWQSEACICKKALEASVSKLSCVMMQSYAMKQKVKNTT